MEKKALRKIFMEQQGRIPVEKSRAAGESMLSLISAEAFWREARSVFCFLGMTGEPDTAPFILRALNEGKSVLVPRTGKNRLMETVPVVNGPDGPSIPFDRDSLSRIIAEWPLSYNIPEPPTSIPAEDPSSLDLVIVPSVAIDLWGCRLGHGAGYYDRFISGFQAAKKRPLLVATQFEELLMSEPLPREPYDMLVDMIVTENRILIPVSFS